MASETDQVMASRGAVAAMSWFFENSLDVFLGVQGDQQTKTNPAWKALTGREPPEALGRSFWDFVHPDDLERVRASIKGLALGERCVVEHRLSSVSGAWLTVQSHAVGGGDGWALIILRDVTAERRREEEAEKARQTAGLLRQAAGVTIWRYDPDRDQYLINPDVSRPAEEDPGREEGASVRASVHDEDAERLGKAWMDTLATGKVHVREYRERLPDQSWRHVR